MQKKKKKSSNSLHTSSRWPENFEGFPCSLDFCFSPQFGKGGGFLEKSHFLGYLKLFIMNMLILNMFIMFHFLGNRKLNPNLRS